MKNRPSIGSECRQNEVKVNDEIRVKCDTRRSMLVPVDWLWREVEIVTIIKVE
jgi:hypothetical protein